MVAMGKLLTREIRLLIVKVYQRQFLSVFPVGCLIGQRSVTDFQSLPCRT